MPFVTPESVSSSTLQNFDKMIENIDSDRIRIEFITACSAKLHRETNIKVMVSLQQLAVSKPYDLVEGKVVLQSDQHKHFNLEIPCYVACGRRLSERSLQNDEIDLLTHFSELLPTAPGIGLVTAQNGIQNTLEDFKGMCHSIITKLERQIRKTPLFIGLYNKTTGIGWGIGEDLQRLTDTWVSNHYSALSLRQMLATFTKRLHDAHPSLRMLHIAHSEGGLIANRCLTNPTWGLSQEQLRLTRKYLITSIYGGVDSIPDDAVLHAVNTYSTKDIALRFAKPYLDKIPAPPPEISKKQKEEYLENARKIAKSGNPLHKNAEKNMAYILDSSKSVYEQVYIKEFPYTSRKGGRSVKIVECTSKNISLIEGDHAFSGRTYQDDLFENLQEIHSDKYRFVS